MNVDLNFDIMKKGILLLFLFLGVICGRAQTSYSFTCDLYEGDKKSCSNLSGVILVDVEEFTNKYCLLISVKYPNHRGRLAFGYNTEPDDASPQMSYQSEFPFDNNLKNVYSIISDGFELMIFVKYVDTKPTQIVMSEKGANNKSIYITIPYTPSTYNGIYNVINEAKRKISFKMK